MSTVWGEGHLADSLRAGIDTSSPNARVFVAGIEPTPRAVATITDADIDEWWEQPMRQLVLAMVEARQQGIKKMVVVVPTIALSGGASYALQSAVSEAAHVLVKSAARQWGTDGVVLNCVVLAPDAFGIDTAVSGEVSLAPRALSGAPSGVEAISWLCSDAASSVTGQTIAVDGGMWM